MTEREYKTPCYIIDEEKLLRDFNMLKDSLEKSAGKKEQRKKKYR